MAVKDPDPFGIGELQRRITQPFGSFNSPQFGVDYSKLEQQLKNRKEQLDKIIVDTMAELEVINKALVGFREPEQTPQTLSEQMNSGHRSR